MSFQEKKAAALAELESSGVWKMNYLPPALVVMWRLGFDVRPPHYNPFWKNALGHGLFFALGWGLLMWLFYWRGTAVEAADALGMSLTAGVLFGLFMGAYIRWSAARHGLSDWRHLPTGRGPD